MDTLDTDEHTPAADAASVWTSAQLSALMTRHGIASRHQATMVAQICAISVSQARRKLRGAVWLFNEVIAMCRHFGESLNAVFSPDAVRGRAAAETGTLPGGAITTYPATLLADDRRIDVDIQLGAILTAPLSAGLDTPLLAMHLQSDGWLVATPERMRHTAPAGPHYAVQHLRVNAAPVQSRPRIAVLDDDAGSAGALTDWFNEVGYQAQAFTSPDQLLAASLTAHDAYVIDLILGGGQTSQGVVEQIRQAQPHAPIVLLTGQLRDGTASEATLSTILRTQGVTFFEKPVRPAVLTAAIQSSLDRVATTHG